jgi:hypothetical protein
MLTFVKVYKDNAESAKSLIFFSESLKLLWGEASAKSCMDSSGPARKAEPAQAFTCADPDLIARIDRQVQNLARWQSGNFTQDGSIESIHPKQTIVGAHP